MLSKHEKYFCFVTDFWWLICKTYLIFKIRGKTYLKIKLVCENFVWIGTRELLAPSYRLLTKMMK